MLRTVALVEPAVEGLTYVDPGSPAHGRHAEMADSYRYLEVELPALMDRWHASRGERQ